MNYTDYLLKKMEEGRGKRVTESIHKWEEAGEKLAGKLVSVKPFTKGSFDTQPMAYVLDTGDANVSCVLGAHTDEQISGSYDIGDFLLIEYQGKKSVADGKRANIFQVTVFKADDLADIADNADTATSAHTTKKGKGKADA